jgi:LPXTG-motif cell wall-anchored protein
MESGVLLLVGVLLIVVMAFILVFRRQNKDVRKISGRGGDFAE